jgi:hypothetical protein
MFCTILIARSLSLSGGVVGRGERLSGRDAEGEAVEIGDKYAPFELSGNNEHPPSINTEQASNVMNFDKINRR